MPTKILWIRQDTVIAIHEAQIAEHGGHIGLRDQGLLESGLARPRTLASYADPVPDVPTLAALYGLAIIKNHPFIDGNKRTALVIIELFLNLNGYQLTASDRECFEAILGVAGERNAKSFSSWVQEHARRRRKSK